ncbi:MAG: M20/M25/M40 family metallo-hydrolase [Ruminococcus sp.]|nr:M20/M25/M40 family metallo-hydrolase [Ruminococcus sp.]
MELREVVFTLSEAFGASGSESSAAMTACVMLRNWCPDARIESGNVIGTFGEKREGLPSLVLDAHIDQVGFIVTSITDEGFIKFDQLGGIDRRLVPAQPVIIHGKRDVPGVICSVPPHLSNGADVVKYEDTAIDTGLTRGELAETVSPGDPVTFDVKCRQLLGERITGAALDDRCGVASILYALELIKDRKPRYNVTVIFSGQEEVSERGAKIGAFQLDPDIAIAVDVSFAMAPGENDKKCGKLGKGPMIGISPSLSREITDGLIETAKLKEIPYQLEVMNGLTSTNADRYSVNRCGCKACTVSVPLRNMHTPVEVIDLEDVRLTAQLLADYITEGE